MLSLGFSVCHISGHVLSSYVTFILVCSIVARYGSLIIIITYAGKYYDLSCLFVCWLVHSFFIIFGA